MNWMRSCSGCEALHAARRVEEVGRPREDPQEALVAIGGVEDLADPVERLSPHVLPHAQDGLGLVDDDDEALVARGLHHLEHALQVGHRLAAGDFSLDARRGASRSTTRRWSLPESHETSAAASWDLAGFCFSSKIVRSARVKSCGALPAVQRGDLLLHALLHLRIEVGPRRSSAPPAMSAFFHPGDPAVQDVAQRAAGAGAGRQPLDDLAVDVVEACGSAGRCRRRPRSSSRSRAQGRRAQASRAMKVLPQP
jgi:hypothetical protein